MENDCDLQLLSVISLIYHDRPLILQVTLWRGTGSTLSVCCFWLAERGERGSLWFSNGFLSRGAWVRKPSRFLQRRVPSSASVARILWLSRQLFSTMAFARLWLLACGSSALEESIYAGWLLFLCVSAQLVTCDTKLRDQCKGTPCNRYKSDQKR